MTYRLTNMVVVKAVSKEEVQKISKQRHSGLFVNTNKIKQECCHFVLTPGGHTCLDIRTQEIECPRIELSDHSFILSFVAMEFLCAMHNAS